MGIMKLMTIGQIAEQCSISRDTIRYYEKCGLLPRAPRTSSGYRLYSEETVRRIRVIQNGIQFGFSLKELAGFLSSRDRGIPPCQSVRAAGEQLVQSIEKQIAELSAARDSMRATLADWDARLTRAPKGSPAGLLANMGTIHRSSRRNFGRKP
jgi:DNA-binding transcriptional MerR regulator